MILVMCGSDKLTSLVKWGHLRTNMHLWSRTGVLVMDVPVVCTKPAHPDREGRKGSNEGIIRTDPFVWNREWPEDVRVAIARQGVM